MIRQGLLAAAACAILCGQTPDPAFDPLDRAYRLIAARAYDDAIAAFQEAVRAAPGRASIRKDLAYAYLKTGQTRAARDQFAEAARLDPADAHAALEYAFLCHETGKTAEARRVFDQVRRAAGEDLRAAAETAFQNVDRPLAEGIDRWLKALDANPGDFSAHREVAELAEKRGELALAAEHYLAAWKIRPQSRNLLVDLGRVNLALGRHDAATAALLAASRGGEPRSAEAAKELLPARYPYVYEFRLAIELDPENITLREELGYLLEAMGQTDAARQEFAALAARGGRGRKPERFASAADAAELGDRSYRAGYLQDALRYYAAAREMDPQDYRVMLQTGWTYNVLGQDAEAARWFALASRSPDPAIAGTAKRAYRNLQPTLARWRTTVWLYPTFSSRWNDVFAYGQVKSELRLGRLPLRAYLTARLIGDTHGLLAERPAQYLAEGSLIFGAGMATNYWHGLMLWAEAGSAARYTGPRNRGPRLGPDYRGGVAFCRGFGNPIDAPRHGWFTETNNDAVFVSRFNNDVVFYTQNRAGLTAQPVAALGGLRTQWYWSAHVSADLRREYWANTLETGPGLRFRWPWMPKSWIMSVTLVRGMYRINDGNPWKRTYTDARVGFWFTGTR